MNTGSWALPLLCVLHLHFGHTQPTTELTLKDMDVMATNQLTIRGLPKLEAKRFHFNIGYGEENIALHFDVRFDSEGDYRTIVLNSLKDGSWSTAKTEKHFPFNWGEEFKVIITFNKDHFLIMLPDNHILSYPNNFGADKFTFIQIKEDLRIKGFNID